MESLLNFDLNDPKTMGLLSAGLQILANNGQMRPGQAIAGGLLGGLGAMQKTADHQVEQQYRDAQLNHLNAETDNLKSKQQEAERQRQAYQQFRQGVANIGNVRTPFVGPYAPGLYETADNQARSNVAQNLRTQGLLGGIPADTVNAILPAAPAPKLETIYDEATGRERKAWLTPGQAPQAVGGVKTDLPWYVTPNGGINPAYTSAAAEEAKAKAAATLPFDLQKAREGRPSVSVQVANKVGESYGEKLAGGVADQDLKLRDAAQGAVDGSRVRQEMRKLLDQGMITGTGANARLQIAKALRLAGFSNSDDVTNTESYVALAAQQTLSQVRASGLGAGNGFSNADREFLEKAQGGQISLDGKSLRRILDLQDKAAQFAHGKWKTRRGQIEKSPMFGTLPPGTLDVPDMPQPQVSATPFRKEMKARDLKRGQSYTLPDGSVRAWDGFQFK